MTIPAQRKKTFTHKVKTGCQRCKSMRVKCDEGKPDCVRCQNKGISCVYKHVDTWIFEPGKPRSKPRRDDLAALEKSPASPQALCSAEEWQSLQFFSSRTGPWMAEHQAARAQSFWTMTLPRMFHSVPATRHLITALGLLEMPTVSDDPEVLDHRSRRVTSHYIDALHEMTKPARHAADITLSAILTWLLEAFMNHGQRAAIHSSAVQRLSYDDKKDIPVEELEIVLADVARARSQRFRCDVVPSDATYVLDAIKLRNQRQEKPTAATIRMRFEEYYQDIFPTIKTPSQVTDAESLIGKWESAILANVYRSDEPTIVWSTLHFICVLSTHVLPIPTEEYFTDLQSKELGLEFVLEKCELVLSHRLANTFHQRALLESARLMVEVLVTHTPRAWRATRAGRLATLADTARDLLDAAGIEHSMTGSHAFGRETNPTGESLFCDDSVGSLYHRLGDTRIGPGDI